MPVALSPPPTLPKSASLSRSPVTEFGAAGGDGLLNLCEIVRNVFTADAIQSSK
jgi:hypothetical protein